MRKTLKDRIAARVEASKDLVFLTREFLDMGGRDQVIRALRQLCREGVLVRIGYGLYAKAARSRFSGEIIAAGFPSAVLRAALDKLEVDWEESCSVRDYNAGLSTQVPVNPVPAVKGRFTRKVVINGQPAEYRRA